MTIKTKVYKKGLLAGLIEARASFPAYLSTDKIALFRFVIEAPSSQMKYLTNAKKHFGCGKIFKAKKSLIYYVGVNKDIYKVISFIKKHYPLRSQKYILFKCWERLFYLFNGVKIGHENQHQWNHALKYYRTLERADKRKYQLKAHFKSKRSPDYIAGFIVGIINFKGFFDYRIYREQKRRRWFPHYQPRLNFYISLHRSDIKLAGLIKETLNCGKIYKSKRMIQFIINSRKEIETFLPFMNKYFRIEPRVYEYKIWSLIFRNIQKYKAPSQGKRYKVRHKVMLQMLARVYNMKARLHMNKAKYLKTAKMIRSIIDFYELKMKQLAHSSN